MKKKLDTKRLILLNFPYVFAFYFVDKIAALFRQAPGTEMIDKLTGGFASFGTAYAKQYPDQCRLITSTKEGSETYEISKARVSIRLTAPYSEERRKAAGERAKQMNADKSSQG